MNVVMSSSLMTHVVQYEHMAAWRTADIQSAKTLGELLAAKRDDTLGTSNPIEQYDVANAVGFSQSYISKIENGRADDKVRRWPSKKQLALLRAYRFCDDEIEQIAERFELDVPSVKNATPPIMEDLSHLGLVSVRVLGDPTKDYDTVPNMMLKGYHEDECFLVYAGKGVLVCDKVREAFRGLPTFSFKYHQEPREGQTVAYRLKDTGELLLCLCKETPPTFAAIDYVDLHRAEIIYPNDERLEYLGVMLFALVDGDPPN